ncbi:TPA: DUF3987 domain-containing protein [Acinetobacter baumannii]|nr:DUF3987 domain-containing protein [Acinetobacter baumannii]
MKIESIELNTSKKAQRSFDDTYPVHAFPEIIAKAIKKSAYYHHVPLSVAGQAYLGELAFIAQNKVDAPSDKVSTGQPCSLFMLTIFPSGEGKDVCKNDANKISRQIELKNIEEYQLDLKKWHALPSKQKGEMPKNPLSIFKKATIQGIVSTISNSESNSFIWSTGEGGYIFNGYSLTSSTAGEALSTLNDLVDTGSANTVLRNEDDNQFFNNKRFSLDIAVQDVIARPALNNELLREQGILARVLFAAPEPLPYHDISWESYVMKSFDDEDIKAYWDFCEKIVNERIVNKFGNERFLIKKSESAEKKHFDYQSYILREVDKNGKYTYIRAYAKRTIQYVLRVATVLSFWERKEIIDDKTMNNAIDLCLFSLNEWVRYYNFSEKSHSKLLLEWLLSLKEKKILKSSILQFAPISLRNKFIRDNAIEYLIDTNMITIEKIGRSDYIVMNQDN